MENNVENFPSPTPNVSRKGGFLGNNDIIRLISGVLVVRSQLAVEHACCISTIGWIGPSSVRYRRQMSLRLNVYNGCLTLTGHGDWPVIKDKYHVPWSGAEEEVGRRRVAGWEWGTSFISHVECSFSLLYLGIPRLGDLLEGVWWHSWVCVIALVNVDGCRHHATATNILPYIRAIKLWIGAVTEAPLYIVSCPCVLNGGLIYIYVRAVCYGVLYAPAKIIASVPAR